MTEHGLASAGSGERTTVLAPSPQPTAAGQPDTEQARLNSNELGFRRPYDPARNCGALKKSDGQPCRKAKGERTDHRGAGHCWLHFGRTPNDARHAATERVEQMRTAAEQACERLGVEIEDDGPAVSLLHAVWKARGNYAFWESRCNAMLAEAGLDALVGQVLGIAQREGTTLALGEEIRAVAREAREWFKEWRTTAKAAVDAGVAEAFVKLRSDQVDIAAHAVRAALAGLPEAEQQNRLNLAINALDQMTARAPAGAELN